MSVSLINRRVGRLKINDQSFRCILYIYVSLAVTHLSAVNGLFYQRRRLVKSSGSVNAIKIFLVWCGRSFTNGLWRKVCQRPRCHSMECRCSKLKIIKEVAATNKWCARCHRNKKKTIEAITSIAFCCFMQLRNI